MTKDHGVGWLVKSIRERLGISQEKLAAPLGVTFSSVNRWENGHRKPSPLAMCRIEELAAKIGLRTEIQCGQSSHG
jgi:putative transcriptional regulator